MFVTKHSKQYAMDHHVYFFIFGTFSIKIVKPLFSGSCCDNTCLR